MQEEDLYARLGVARSADAATLRRAFRQLALRFHPDRAGVGATATFQRIAAAYGVLSNPARRADYDRTLPGRGVRAAAPRPQPAAAERVPVPERVIVRLCGHLSALVACGAARVHADGTIDLVLTAEEQRAGGMAAIALRLPLTCPVCGGLADRHGFDCERCGFEGSVLEGITVWVPIAPGLADGHAVAVPIDPLAPHRRLRVRLRVQSAAR